MKGTWGRTALLKVPFAIHLENTRRPGGADGRAYNSAVAELPLPGH